MKKPFLLLAFLSVFVMAVGSTWADPGLIGNQGDFASFQLGDSQKTTLQKYESLVKSNVIAAENSEEQNAMTFSARFLNEDFDGDLYFDGGQLVSIQISQNRGFSEKQFAGELRDFVDKTLLPYMKSRFGNAQTTYDYPEPDEVDDGLIVVAEWIKGDKKISVGLSKDGNEYFSAIAIEKASVNADGQESQDEEDEEATGD